MIRISHRTLRRGTKVVLEGADLILIPGQKIGLIGSNGTGKSKALELLLPFLFDANLRANRLSTFGTGERTMHWNLMGEGATGATRVGYVWMEFQRGDGWFSCGARLQASTHTSTVQPDYFTTSLRSDGAFWQAANSCIEPITLISAS